ncbi:MAG: hypothetical protein WC516_06685 [Patescibacteria group bacterium]|jgi:hypothetical protein
MEIKNFDSIPEKYRYRGSTEINIDSYNPGVYRCKECNSNQLDHYFENPGGLCGFTMAVPWLPPEIRDDGYHERFGHVWECQECFTVQWHHIGIDFIKKVFEWKDD